MQSTEPCRVLLCYITYRPHHCD